METQYLLAGAAAVDVTPQTPQFLYGYPHVARTSTGVHDALLSSALYLASGAEQLLFIANDTIFIGRSTARRVREVVARATGVPAGNILISATHTHSGPLACDYSRRDIETDTPDPDPAYLRLLEEGMVRAACQAYEGRRPAEAGLALADAAGIGTNRHDPRGAADLQVPVLAVREAESGRFMAVMLVCCMHPTVLHEDSRLASADFPGMARQYLQQKLVGEGCPVLHHTGPAGNQSPRHVTRGNTFAEAQRLGEILGKAVALALETVDYERELPLACCREELELPRRDVPAVADAKAREAAARKRLEQLRSSGALATEVRTAECDWFGAEEALALARAGANGNLEAAYRACLPAEVQLCRVGKWSFVGWPCEIFVEFGQAVREREPDAFVISLANGELRGYLVTRQAIEEGWYEAGNALFKSPESGERLVRASLGLLSKGTSSRPGRESGGVR